MVNQVTTLYGTFDEKQLRTLKGYIDEIILHLQKNEANNQAIKDILEISHDELKIPKKIIKRMATTQHKQSLQTEVAEFKELESLIESITSIK
jgi:DNA-binding transcriptional MerR regulator